MSDVELRVLRHATLYGWEHVLGDHWCPIDYCRTVDAQDGGCCRVPFLICSPITLAKVRALAS
jgi:hypothetical protein